MYHHPVGPMAATGIGGGTALFAFTPLGLVWAFLAVFAVVGAVGALMRIVPSMRGPRRAPRPRQEVLTGS